MAAKTKKVVRRTDGLWERVYIPEILRGMGVTAKHFFRNVFLPVRHPLSWRVTWEYPEVKREYPERFRGLHRLMERPERKGEVRCVACMCCARVCPANCITIAEEEHPSSAVEKGPASFVIDELRCVVCGLCVEACPCDAIRMDTSLHPTPAIDRKEFIHPMAKLREHTGPSIAVQGGKEGWWDKVARVVPQPTPTPKAPARKAAAKAELVTEE